MFSALINKANSCSNLILTSPKHLSSWTWVVIKGTLSKKETQWSEQRSSVTIFFKPFQQNAIWCIHSCHSKAMQLRVCNRISRGPDRQVCPPHRPVVNSVTALTWMWKFCCRAHLSSTTRGKEKRISKIEKGQMCVFLSHSQKCGLTPMPMKVPFQKGSK